MPETLTVECLHQGEDLLGEGPLYLEGFLYWVDIKRNRLFRLSLKDGCCQERTFDEQVTSIHPAKPQGFVVTVRSGFGFLADFDAEINCLGDVEPEYPKNRFNDGKVDPFGHLWAGTMDDSEQQASGSLYRLGSDKSVQRFDQGYIITNGPTFSADAKSLYHTDTIDKAIYQFDLEAAGISNKRLFLRLGEAEGHPDGMTTDAEGCLWVCHYGGWCLSRYSPDGELMKRIQLPVANVTSCAFGGADLETLFITTARQGLTAKDLLSQPLAGSLFASKPGVTGLPANVFGGT